MEMLKVLLAHAHSSSRIIFLNCDLRCFIIAVDVAVNDWNTLIGDDWLFGARDIALLVCSLLLRSVRRIGRGMMQDLLVDLVVLLRHSNFFVDYEAVCARLHHQLLCTSAIVTLSTVLSDSLALIRL